MKHIFISDLNLKFAVSDLSECSWMNTVTLIITTILLIAAPEVCYDQ